MGTGWRGGPQAGCARVRACAAGATVPAPSVPAAPLPAPPGPTCAAWGADTCGRWVHRGPACGRSSAWQRRPASRRRAVLSVQMCVALGSGSDARPGAARSHVSLQARPGIQGCSWPRGGAGGAATRPGEPVCPRAAGCLRGNQSVRRPWGEACLWAPLGPGGWAAEGPRELQVLDHWSTGLAISPASVLGWCVWTYVCAPLNVRVSVPQYPPVCACVCTRV